MERKAVLYGNNIVFIVIMYKYWSYFLVIVIAALWLPPDWCFFQSLHSRDPHFYLCCQPGQFLAGAYHSHYPHHPLCHLHSLPHGHHPVHSRPVCSGSRVGQPRPAHPAEGPAEHPGHHERACQRPGRWERSIRLKSAWRHEINLTTRQKRTLGFLLIHI